MDRESRQASNAPEPVRRDGPVRSAPPSSNPGSTSEAAERNRSKAASTRVGPAEQSKDRGESSSGKKSKKAHQSSGDKRQKDANRRLFQGDEAGD